MARKSQEIFDLLKAEMVAFPELAALVSDVDNAQELFVKLSTNSPVANWDLMTWIMAVCSASTEAEVEHSLAQIIVELEKRKYGTAGWYVAEALKFQLGDTITWQLGNYFYNPVNVDLRVVKHAAVVAIAQGIRLKLAKVVGAQLGPMSGPELTAVTAYFNDQVIGIKPAGVQLIVTTGAADLVKMTVRVVRNPQVLASDGSLLTDGAVFPVEDAIKNYIQYLAFNGELNLTKLEDAIQFVDGVVDVEIDSAEYKYGAFPYAAIDLAYNPDAGYAKIDPLFPLSGSITYSLV